MSADDMRTNSELGQFINMERSEERELARENIALGNILPQATLSTSNPKPIDF
jgi:hypothetical protein